jgi:hypothetical protein
MRGRIRDGKDSGYDGVLFRILLIVDRAGYSSDAGLERAGLAPLVHVHQRHSQSHHITSPDMTTRTVLRMVLIYCDSLTLQGSMVLSTVSSCNANTHDKSLLLLYARGPVSDM